MFVVTYFAFKLLVVMTQRHYSQLKEEFAKMKPPADVVDDDTDDAGININNSSVTSPPPAAISVALPNVTVTSSAAAGASSGGSSETLSSSEQATTSGHASDSDTSATAHAALATSLTAGESATPAAQQPEDVSELVTSTAAVGSYDTSNIPKQLSHGHSHVSSSPSSQHGHVTSPQQVPMSNGDISEDMASMMLGPEDDGGGPVTSQDAYNLHTTDDILFL